MNKFAKLFEFDNHQVLAFITYISDDDEYQLVLRTDLDGIEGQIKMSFKSEDNCEDAFNNLNESTATEFRNNIVNTLRGVEE